MLSLPRPRNGFAVWSVNESSLINDVFSPSTICTLNSNEASNFCFSSIGFNPWDVASAYEDLQGLDGVKKGSVSFQWVQNHYRWIVWKSGCLCRAFPKLIASFTPGEVLCQLLTRYTNEVIKCRRSAVKKIVERDDIPSRPLVLLVAQVISSNEIEVSDGWYSMKATLDPAMSDLVQRGRLREGVKIVTIGATLSSGEGISVLEAMDSSVRLALTYNSTRRCKWHQKLGYQKWQILVPLSSVKTNGGRIAGVDVLVERIYPVCFIVESETLKTRKLYTQREYDHYLDKFESSPTPSQVSEFKGSKVSSFARWRIKCLVDQATTANLTIWNPDLNNCSVKEGDVVRLLGLTVRKQTTAANNDLNLQTTKCSKIIPVKQGSRINCRTIYNRCPKDKFPEEIDFFGIIESLPTDANEKSMSLLIKDAEGSMMYLMIPKRICASFPKVKPGVEVTMLDVTFMYYDQNKQAPVYSFTDRSNVKLQKIVRG